MQYRTTECPYCNNKLEVMQARRISLGSPIIRCKFCSQPIKDLDIKEWETLSASERIKFILRAIFGLLVFYGFGSVLVVFMVFLYLIDKDIGERFINNYSFLCFLFGFLVFLISVFILSRNMKKEIALSKKRLSDPEYAWCLLENQLYVPYQYLVHKKKAVLDWKEIDNNDYTIILIETPIPKWAVEINDKTGNKRAVIELSKINIIYNSFGFYEIETLQNIVRNRHSEIVEGINKWTATSK